MLKLHVDRSGIEFRYKGDAVIWLWPWRRNGDGHAWLSVGFDCCYASLADVDAEWAALDLAERQAHRYRLGEPICFGPDGEPVAWFLAEDTGQVLSVAHSTEHYGDQRYVESGAP